MDLERISLEGTIDAEKLLRISELAQELGIRVVASSQPEALRQENTSTPIEEELIVPPEVNNDIEHEVSIDELREWTVDNLERLDYPSTTKVATRGYNLVNEVWDTFLNAGVSDEQADYYENKVGVRPPTFAKISWMEFSKTYYSRTTESEITRKHIGLNVSETTGLDIDQSARFLVALSNEMEAIYPTQGSPYPKRKISELRPKPGYPTCLSLMCEYIMDRFEKENYLPEGVTLEDLRKTEQYFRKHIRVGSTTPVAK